MISRLSLAGRGFRAARRALDANQQAYELRAEAKRKAATGQLLQRPRAHRGHGRAAGKGNGDRRAQLQGARRLGRQCQQDERIVLGFLDHESVVADLFQQARVGGDRMEIE